LRVDHIGVSAQFVCVLSVVLHLAEWAIPDEFHTPPMEDIGKKDNSSWNMTVRHKFQLAF